ncbi:hypothetical protein EYM_01995 [Ignicoccus islandicus DSM 13165]|uniref:Uncharacterized protein n=1 Tax=Ignicoccus islandicus DSM 13165 TaxID=940295 RepID=A0A0U2WMT7_9CREN|nr:hypothetical protein [Ignicoccus islandicus]ALU12273.1 hypothetical protein EYM_01995 [Ignicoccus islandicus DSM 13165]
MFDDIECVQTVRIKKELKDMFLLENDMGGLAIVPKKNICDVIKKLKICIENLNVKCK